MFDLVKINKVLISLNHVPGRDLNPQLLYSKQDFKSFLNWFDVNLYVFNEQKTNNIINNRIQNVSIKA